MTWQAAKLARESRAEHRREPEAADPARQARRAAEAARAAREERVLAACECVIDLASALFNVCGKELRRPGRCTDDISRVRQIAMYVAHVVLELSMSDLGKGFGRDRTTVLHACHLIEDMRDDAEFERIVARTERVVAAAFRGRPAL